MFNLLKTADMIALCRGIEGYFRQYCSIFRKAVSEHGFKVRPIPLRTLLAGAPMRATGFLKIRNLKKESVIT